MSTIPLEMRLTSPSFFQDPHSLLHQIRAEDPVYWSDGWGVWVLTRYQDVVSVLKDHDHYINYGRVTHLIDQLPDDVSEAKAALKFHYETGLAHTDPPQHTRLRGLLNRAFTPRMVAEWRGRIDQVVEDLIHDLKETSSFDLLESFAYPLPATIIAEMLGVPRSDVYLFQGWALAINQLFEKGGRISPESATKAYENLKEMRHYIGKLVEDRRKSPREDIVGNLARIEAEGEKLSLNELVSTIVTFFVAGHDTTTNLIANGMYLMLQSPGTINELRADPDKIKVAVEETLRMEPSVPRMWRIATEDIELDGKEIKAGQMVFPMLSAANRDPAYFPEPDRFSLTRKNMKHVAFGFGVHYCIGAPLARLEGSIALSKLINAFPQLGIAEEPVWTEDIAIRRMERLVLTEKE